MVTNLAQVATDVPDVLRLEADAALVGHHVELVFDPFDLTTVEVRYQGRPTTRRSKRARPHQPRAAPVPDPGPAPGSGSGAGAPPPT